MLRVSRHIAQKFLSANLVLVGSSSFSWSPSLLSAGVFTAEHEIVLGGGGEGEAAWEEKKEAQERPIRLAAALRHLASVPSPPHPPASGAIARSSPSATGQHHRPPFPAVLGGGVNAPAWLASFWFWYMKQKGTMLTVAV